MEAQYEENLRSVITVIMGNTVNRLDQYCFKRRQGIMIDIKNENTLHFIKDVREAIPNHIHLESTVKDNACMFTYELTKNFISNL